MSLTEEAKKTLIQKALQVRENAYAPYSTYKVGAALRTKKENVYTGANVENAAYSVTMCAERAAVFSAIAAGEREFDALVVATRNGGTPCGSCRQVLSEYGLDIQVFIVDETGDIMQETTVRDLLPSAFRSGDLED
ncbi:MAG: cytidine deaminase [Anaerolineales bacterium]